MIQTVYLVRHCQYSNPRKIYPGRLPVSLSTAGRAEAVLLHRYFTAKKIDRIYSSPVLRAKQTAEIISNDAIPVQFELDLAETFSAYQGFWPLPDEPYSATLPNHFYSHQAELGGETYLDVQKRMTAFFTRLTTTSFREVIVCSHGDPLQSLYYHIAGLPLPRIEDEAGERGGDPNYQPKGSIRTLTLENGVPQFAQLITQKQLAEQHSAQG
jgi:broad specificity phosphatase PhoE